MFAEGREAAFLTSGRASGDQHSGALLPLGPTMHTVVVVENVGLPLSRNDVSANTASYRVLLRSAEQT
jgi:hypothetical protein